MLRRNYGKRFGIDRENRFFHIEVIFPNLRRPKLFIKDEFLELKDGNFFANVQTILPACFIVTKHQSCSPSVNNAKKHEHKVTSNIGDCFSNIHTLSLNFVVWHGM